MIRANNAYSFYFLFNSARIFQKVNLICFLSQFRDDICLI